MIKLLEENIGRTLFDINHSNTFLDPSPKAKEIKKKRKETNSWDIEVAENIERKTGQHTQRESHTEGGKQIKKTRC